MMTITVDENNPHELRHVALQLLQQAQLFDFEHVEFTELARFISKIKSVSPEEWLFAHRREERFVTARRIFWYILHRHFGGSLPQIGRIGAGWDHTTVLHHVQAFDRELAAKPLLRQLVNLLVTKTQKQVQAGLNRRADSPAVRARGI